MLALAAGNKKSEITESQFGGGEQLAVYKEMNGLVDDGYCTICSHLHELQPRAWATVACMGYSCVHGLQPRAWATVVQSRAWAAGTSGSL